MVGFFKTIWTKTSLTIKTLQLLGHTTSGIKTLITDSSGDILWATGTTKPSDTTTGYAKGCLFIDTDVATGTSGLYVNVGTNTSCVFKLVSNA